MELCSESPSVPNVSTGILIKYRMNKHEKITNLDCSCECNLHDWLGIEKEIYLTWHLSKQSDGKIKRRTTDLQLHPTKSVPRMAIFTRL